MNKAEKLNRYLISLISLIIISYICSYFPPITLANDNVLNNKTIYKDYSEEYYSLIKALKNNSVNVSKSYHEKIKLYIDTHTKSILDLKIEGQKLTWFIVKIYFIRTDLIYAIFEDGHRYGGEVLLKVNCSGSQIISIQRLWVSY